MTEPPLARLFKSEKRINNPFEIVNEGGIGNRAWEDKGRLLKPLTR